MRVSALLPAIVLLLSLACAARETAPPPPPRPELRYYVKSAGDSALAVTLVVEKLGSDSLDFTFPTWLPGDLRPIEPGRWVEDVRAYDRATVELPVRRLGPNAWRVFPRRAPYFLVTYTLHSVRPDGFKRALISELTPEGGYFTGAVAFGYFRGLENYPLSLTFELGPRRAAFCSLESTGPGRYQAPGAYELSQTGCAYGARVREARTFVQGVPHRLVLAAPPGFDPDSLVRVIGEVVEAQAALFDRLPYPEYTFFVHFVKPTTSGLGGAALFRGSAYYLPEVRAPDVRTSAIPHLLAHQLFHAWNLWAFPPAELARPALDRPPVTRSLWLVEGLADHYARVSLARARIVSKGAVYADIARLVRWLEERPSAARTNLESASAAAATGVGREILDALAIKSPVAALGIDVELRRASSNAFGADSLLRFLEGGSSGPRVLPYDSIVGWMVELGGPPLRSLYAGAIAGPGALSTAEILAGAGLELATREVEEANLGASLIPDGRGFVFRDVVPQGIGGRMGLRSGDRLVAVNEQPISPDNLFPLLAVIADLRSGLREGKPLTITVDRGGQSLQLRGTLLPWTREITVLVESERASPSATAVREAIFSTDGRQALGS